MRDFDGGPLSIQSNTIKLLAKLKWKSISKLSCLGWNSHKAPAEKKDPDKFELRTWLLATKDANFDYKKGVVCLLLFLSLFNSLVSFKM